MKTPLLSGLAAAWIILVTCPAPAVIVGGTNGDGLGNATEAGMQAYLSSLSQPAFPYWNNLLRVSDSSGVYLGGNGTTGRGWIVTATHVTPLTVGTSTITVAGQAYVVRESHVLQHTDLSGTYNTDIRLYAIGGESGDPALPVLTTIPVLDTDVLEGDTLLLTGRGRRQQLPSEDTTPPYHWDGAWDEANQATRQMRWGSNTVGIYAPAAPDVLFEVTEGVPTTKKTISFASVFDDPAAGGTAYEGQLALLDSGGGAFIEHGGTWYLAGTNYTVDDGPDADSDYNPAGYGDYSVMTHLPTYRDQILTITGIPESATATMAGALAFLTISRRKRVTPRA